MPPHDPYKVEPRKRLTDKQRLELFIRHNGICCVCGHKIDGVREMWDEHVNPLWLNGDNTAENRAPAHAKCARGKTAEEATTRAKVRSVAEKHFGATRKTGFSKPKGMRYDWKLGRYVKDERGNE